MLRCESFDGARKNEENRHLMSHDFSQFTVTYSEKSLQFHQPAGTSRGVYRTRKVWYVEVRAHYDGRAVNGIGECAPLPQLSCDDVPDFAEQLARACQMWQDTQCIPRNALRDFPSILMALETAERSLRACAESGSPFLLSDTAFARGEVGIPINGLVWMGTADEMLARMEGKLSAGFRCVKIKIGAIDFAAEVNLLRILRQRFSKTQVELRLDANGAFAPSEALEKLRQLAAFDIHSIEQPIRAGQWETMAKLCRKSPIPIALDEELIGINTRSEKERLLDTISPQYIILKPSLHGGFSGAEEWEDLADARGIPHWATSALESNVGLNAIAHWTARRQAARGSDGAANMPQGLGTGQLFANNYPHVSLEIRGDELWMGAEKDRDFQHLLRKFSDEWQDDARVFIELQTSGSTGSPKRMTATKTALRASAERTLRALDIRPGSSAFLCLPLQYIAGKMMVVRALVGNLCLISATPSLHPYAHLQVAPHFAALTPAQAAASLEVPEEKALLEATECVILGGGSVGDSLESSLQTCQGRVFSTYGMTETLSHIALRRINGSERSQWYVPLPGVKVSLSDEGCLRVHDPATNDAPLLTNDLATINEMGHFRILGRRDNVVCSGGLKLHLEALESKVAALEHGLLFTAVPDDALGEALVCLHLCQQAEKDVRALCATHLSKHEQPRHFIGVDALPLTETGKPARAAAKELATAAVRLERNGACSTEE